MPNKRLLVIDDDPAILASLELLLEDAGYFVESSTKNGEVIDHMIRTNPPDLIVLDILLSGQDGRTICMQLKGNQSTKHIPIILMSAHPDAGAMSRSAGADAFVSKPFDIDDLLKMIEDLIAGRS